MMILRLLAHPLEVLRDTALNRPLNVRFRSQRRFGALVTLAGYGYPYVRLEGPKLPIEIRGELDCDVWWNEAARGVDGRLIMTGHRIAEVAAVASNMEAALRRAYATIRRIHCLGSYYRLDIGRSLWPPGRT
jgi:phosphoribosylamine-glycine ligase